MTPNPEEPKPSESPIKAIRRRGAQNVQKKALKSIKVAPGKYVQGQEQKERHTLQKKIRRLTARNAKLGDELKQSKALYQSLIDSLKEHAHETLANLHVQNNTPQMISLTESTTLSETNSQQSTEIIRMINKSKKKNVQKDK